jgi:hypothetical protein
MCQKAEMLGHIADDADLVAAGSRSLRQEQSVIDRSGRTDCFTGLDAFKSIQGQSLRQMVIEVFPAAGLSG